MRTQKRIPRVPRSVMDRFEAKVTFEPNTGCHLWTGSVLNSGYGSFSIGYEKYLAHRFALRQRVKTLSRLAYVDHVCRTPLCVNPDHLRPVSPRVNAVENSRSRSAVHAAKAKCPRCDAGYRRRVNGARFCVACENRRRRARYRARQGAV